MKTKRVLGLVLSLMFIGSFLAPYKGLAKEPVKITADHDWLETAILDLLDNAIKYTPAGGRVLASVENRGTEQILEIRDTGIGIPEDALPHIFERFYRVDPSRNGGNEGAGLGLSLVLWIVEQHHGRIFVANAQGGGSIFTVRLPIYQEVAEQ